MVTALRAPQRAFFAIAALLLCVSQGVEAQALRAQDVEAYRAIIRTEGGGPSITGFLYAVNDSAVVILPARFLTRKSLAAALENPKPISLPLSLVRKVKVIKQRSYAHDASVGALLSLGYSIAYFIVVPIYSVGGLIPYMIVVTGLSLGTYDLLYAKKFKPTKPGFKMRMQRYCLNKDDLVLDWQ